MGRRIHAEVGAPVRRSCACAIGWQPVLTPRAWGREDGKGPSTWDTFGHTPGKVLDDIPIAAHRARRGMRAR
jgi:hypothetical protein